MNDEKGRLDDAVSLMQVNFTSASVSADGFCRCRAEHVMIR